MTRHIVFMRGYIIHTSSAWLYPYLGRNQSFDYFKEVVPCKETHFGTTDIEGDDAHFNCVRSETTDRSSVEN